MDALAEMVKEHGFTAIVLELARLAGEKHKTQPGWDRPQNGLLDVGELTVELDARINDAP